MAGSGRAGGRGRWQGPAPGGQDTPRLGSGILGRCGIGLRSPGSAPEASQECSRRNGDGFQAQPWRCSRPQARWNLSPRTGGEDSAAGASGTQVRPCCARGVSRGRNPHRCVQWGGRGDNMAGAEDAHQTPMNPAWSPGTAHSPALRAGAAGAQGVLAEGSPPNSLGALAGVGASFCGATPGALGPVTPRTWPTPGPGSAPAFAGSTPPGLGEEGAQQGGPLSPWGQPCGLWGRGFPAALPLPACPRPPSRPALCYFLAFATRAVTNTSRLETLSW